MNTLTTFEFYHNSRIVQVTADDIVGAKTIFQERYGYWPSSSQIVQQ